MAQTNCGLITGVSSGVGRAIAGGEAGILAAKGRTTMGRQTLRCTALAFAWLGCTPIAPPSMRPGEPAPERIPDVSPPQPAAVLFIDASPFQEPDADAVIDVAPSPEHAMELPADASTPPAPPFNPLLRPWHRRPPPPETARDAERRRLRGSPSDMHTPEGVARGYYVSRHCTSYSLYDVVAVMGTGKKPIPQFGRASPSFGKQPSEDIEKEFWAFAKAVRRAAAVSSIHDGGASSQCFGGDAYAVVLNIHDWRQVDQAIRNVGSWLAAHDWSGDVIILPAPIPGPAYPH